MIKSADDIKTALYQSPFHLDALRALRHLNLPQGYIAAGFVRNLVWDIGHGYKKPTPLNDIDVIYFDPANTEEAQEKSYETALSGAMPGLPWSVKNQARMHVKNGDAPYETIEDALCHWCETPTPIGARLDENDHIQVIAPLGVSDLVNLECRAPPFARSKPAKMDNYRERILSKNWAGLWPKLKLYDLDIDEKRENHG